MIIKTIIVFLYHYYYYLVSQREREREGAHIAKWVINLLLHKQTPLLLYTHHATPLIQFQPFSRYFSHFSPQFNKHCLFIPYQFSSSIPIYIFLLHGMCVSSLVTQSQTYMTSTQIMSKSVWNFLFSFLCYNSLTWYTNTIYILFFQITTKREQKKKKKKKSTNYNCWSY